MLLNIGYPCHLQLCISSTHACTHAHIRMHLHKIGNQIKCDDVVTIFLFGGGGRGVVVDVSRHRVVVPVRKWCGQFQSGWCNTLHLESVFYVHTYGCMHALTHTHTDIHTHAHTDIHTHTHTHTHTDIHTHAMTYTHTHTHTH